MPISGSPRAVFTVTEIIDIRLDGGETQLLEYGLYCVHAASDITWSRRGYAQAEIHIEVYLGGVWRDFLRGPADDDLQLLLSDGINVRVASGDAPGTFNRLTGVRFY